MLQNSSAEGVSCRERSRLTQSIRMDQFITFIEKMHPLQSRLVFGAGEGSGSSDWQQLLREMEETEAERGGVESQGR